MASPITTERRRDVVKWLLPMDDLVKANADGSTFSHMSFSSIDIVIRDHSRNFIASKAVRLDRTWEVDNVKATTVLEGMCFVSQLGYARIVVEGDSKSLIDSLHCNPSSIASFFGGHFA